ncbi:Putative bacteriocin-protection protein YdeI [Paucilactobacillus oligofermentans DSM 15707 = LMG 22743]|nr:YdeI/OmpD-associated family protein [Paucilactobacillus oligofermentans]CUS26822.1 Putative bacteriocin-protection protein YdeI [Paucilactobacillus oligofermentans DSM 15707 = LMG 22743]
MEIDFILQLTTRKQLRKWLQENSKTKNQCWVLTTRATESGTINKTMDYLDAVEEAMCFGWIDSTIKKVSETQLAQRMSPRRQKSQWSELNKERVRRLEKLGLMTDQGRKCCPDLSYDSFTIDEEIMNAIQNDEIVYQNFKKFPELYKRVRIDTIQIKKKQPLLFQKRLDKFIENTRENKMYGGWNDNGRLIKY